MLIADAFGAVLHAASREEFDNAAPGGFAISASLRGNCALLGGREIRLDLPADGLAISNNGHTAAVTSPYTHAIRLLPLQ